MANSKLTPTVSSGYKLWFLLGFLGVHRFYAGRMASGAVLAGLFAAASASTALFPPIVALVLFGVTIVWWIADGFLIRSMIETASTTRE